MLVGSLMSVVFATLQATAPSAAADWQPVECVAADPAPEALFDVVKTIDDFETQPLKWEPLHGSQNAQATLTADSAGAHSGQGSMRVDYQFAGREGLEYLQFNTNLQLTRPEWKLGFWVNTDGTAFRFRLRIVDSSGETHQLEMSTANRPGWQFAAPTADVKFGAWGGDGNRRLDYPCRLAGIVVDRPQVPYVAKGSMWIDDVTLLRPRKPAPSTLAIEVRDGRFGNLYDAGQVASLRAHGQGDHIRWQAVDFWNQKVAEGQGPATGVEARFALSRPGYFACIFDLMAGERLIESKTFSAAALPPGDKIGPSDFLGMCTHFGHGTYPLDYMSLMQRYGIDQFRDEISWGSMEKERGQYQLPPNGAAFLQKAVELKMRPLLIFDYANRHYDNGGFPNSPEAIAGFTAYAVQLARQTRGIVNQFEVWNEWVLGCGMHDKPGVHDGEAYAKLLNPTYAAVKRARPEVTVVGVGGENGTKCAETIAGIFRTAGVNAMDGWSIHPYRYPRTPEASDLLGEVGRMAEVVAQAGARQKAWLTEIGWPTHRGPSGTEEHAQAILGVRALALLQSSQLVERVFWYDLKDDGLKRSYNENNFGVLHHQHYNAAPKPAIVAMSVFICMTHGAACRSLWHEGDAHAVSYQLPNGNHRLVAWSTRPDTPVRLAGRLVEIHDLMANPLPRPKTIVLTPTPIYLTGQGLELSTSN
jgi:hypothetical protein